MANSKLSVWGQAALAFKRENAIAMHARMVLHRERERGYREAELAKSVAAERARWEAELEAEKEARRQKRRKSSSTSGVHRRKSA